MTGRFRSNKPKRTHDTKTGKTYDARNKAGQAVASVEFPDLDTGDPFVWYQVLRRCPPRRFIDVETKRGIDTHGSLM